MSVIGAMPITVNLDVMLAKRKVSLTDLSKAVGLSLTNLSMLKNGKVKGVRFGTLEKICIVLNCQPGDLLEFQPYTDTEIDRSSNLIEATKKNIENMK